MDGLEYKTKLIKAIESAPSREALSGYLEKYAEYLRPVSPNGKVISLYDAVIKLLNEQDTKSIEVHSRHEDVEEFFFLTPGLHVIAAPSGHGKTLWAMEWAESAAKNNSKVFMASLEMTPKDLAARKLTGLVDLPLKEIIQQKLSEIQRIVLKEKVESKEFNYFKNIFIGSFDSLDWVKLQPSFTDMLVKIRPQLIIVDYVQMIYDSAETDARMSQRMANIARELKVLADSTGIAVLLLSQMNREVLKSFDPKTVDHLGFVPMNNSYIKESGGIVEAADSVQLVCIPARFPTLIGTEIRNKFQITVDKSRRLGQLGTALLPFDSEKMKFI